MTAIKVLSTLTDRIRTYTKINAQSSSKISATFSWTIVHLLEQQTCKKLQQQKDNQL